MRLVLKFRSKRHNERGWSLWATHTTNQIFDALKLGSVSDSWVLEIWIFNALDDWAGYCIGHDEHKIKQIYVLFLFFFLVFLLLLLLTRMTRKSYSILSHAIFTSTMEPSSNVPCFINNYVPGLTLSPSYGLSFSWNSLLHLPLQ
jgi:hypothetical protein